MDYKCLVLALFIAGAAAQDIVDFPPQPVGMSVGYRHVITCGIRDRNGKAVSWTRDNTLIFDGERITDTTNYDIEIDANSNPAYYNLVVSLAPRGVSGIYTCQCLPASRSVPVLIFEEPTLAPVDNSVLVAGMEQTMRCEVLYGAENLQGGQIWQDFQLEILDGEGVRVTDSNTDDFYTDLTTDPDEYRRFVNTTTLTLDWEDDWQEYACVISMLDYSENVTVSLDVLHTASNITLSPYDAQNEYYKTEVVTVEYSSNPAAKQWIWSRFIDGQWQVIDDDDDQDQSITIGNWPRDTSIKVDIINNFDHDGDNVRTDQNGTEIFPLTIYDCCRTGDASHVTYSALMTSLFVFISAFLLQR